jgi:hypothetical protein
MDDPDETVRPRIVDTAEYVQNVSNFYHYMSFKTDRGYFRELNKSLTF